VDKKVKERGTRICRFKEKRSDNRGRLHPLLEVIDGPLSFIDDHGAFQQGAGF
jgi:hypothetical protein